MSDLEQSGPDKKFVASAVLVGLIVIAGLVLGGVKLFRGDAEPSPKPTSSTTSGASSSSICDLPDGDQAVPTKAPPTEWYFKGKVAVPRSAELGPGNLNGGVEVANCFAHNPAGALFAAATIAAETSSFSTVAEEAVLAHILPGDLRDQLLADLKLDPTPGPLAQIVGFKFEDHTRDRATVTLASRLVDGPNAGAMGATPMTLVWQKGDWYQELQASSTTVIITSLDGFVAWSGIS